MSLIEYIFLRQTNSLDPDQFSQNAGPDMDPNCLKLIVFLKESFEKVNFEKKKSNRRQQKHKKIAQYSRSQ